MVGFVGRNMHSLFTVFGSSGASEVVFMKKE